MADHLPECWCASDDAAPHAPGHDRCSYCICDRLRQAEQRVTEGLTFPQMAAHSYNKGYAAGVTAARDAVAGLQLAGEGPSYVAGASDALAAIDALKEK